MSFRQSIRLRILLWNGALLFLMCLGFGITAYRLERAKALERLDLTLESRLNSLVTGVNRAGSSPRPPPPRGRRGQDHRNRPPVDDFDRWVDELLEEDDRHLSPGLHSPDVVSLFVENGLATYFYQLWNRDHEFVAKSQYAPDDMPMPLNKAQGGQDKAIRSRAGFREAFVFTPPGECYLTGISLKEMELGMQRIAWEITLIGTGVLVAGLAVGWWIATRALRPIAEITTAAARIAAGNLQERIRTADTESELGKLASVLDETFHKLDVAFEEQARFTSDAAHELRTPVAVILAQSQLALSKEREPREYRETIEINQRAAKRMHGLIESLLQLAVLDSGSQPNHFHSCDLARIAREQMDLIEPLASQKSIILILEAAQAVCPGDVEQLAQIVNNLLGNAVKFSPPGAEIRIRTSSKDGLAILSVTDNGPGIPSVHLAHLFERFYRVESSRNRATGGAGLGLAISRRIAQAHSGSLEVNSIEGSGSEFTLYIPSSVSPVA